MRRGDERKRVPGVRNMGYLVNEDIRAKEIRLVGKDGENFGIVDRSLAVAKAEEASLDLVKIGENDGVLIAKLMDFGKYLYLKKKKQAESKKNQKTIQIKETKMRPNIGEQDYLTKLNHSVKFLKDGKRVKLTLQFRGREKITMNEVARRFFERVTKDLEDREIGNLAVERETHSGPFWSKLYYLK